LNLLVQDAGIAAQAGNLLPEAVAERRWRRCDGLSHWRAACADTPSQRLSATASCSLNKDLIKLQKKSDCKYLQSLFLSLFIFLIFSFLFAGLAFILAASVHFHFTGGLRSRPISSIAS
jgi:hypothetical protein